jgi:hypothetical protein
MTTVYHKIGNLPTSYNLLIVKKYFFNRISRKNILITFFMNKLLLSLLLIALSMATTTTSLAEYRKPVRPTYSQSCSQSPALNTNITLSPEEKLAIQPYLNRLNVYQGNCNSKAFGSIMFFTSMPTDPSLIIQESNRTVNFLKGMSKIGLKPIVVAEPTNLNFVQFSNGAYDQFISDYFTNLKAQGVTDSIMGTWVPFPEANLPAWDNLGSTPTMIAQNFNRYMSILQSKFSTVKGSLLLNSRTYAPEDKNYTNGQYKSFAEYGANLDSRYLDSVGIQGFPWYSPKNQQWGNTKTADIFLQPGLATEFAKAAKVNKVWFNTGSASSVYTNDKLKTVVIPSQDRAAVLNSILTAAKQVKANLGLGSNVMLNIFAQDKSQTPEAINWSYTQLSDLAIFKTFLINANLARIDLGYFDFSY